MSTPILPAGECVRRRTTEYSRSGAVAGAEGDDGRRKVHVTLEFESPSSRSSACLRACEMKPPHRARGSEMEWIDGVTFRQSVCGWVGRGEGKCGTRANSCNSRDHETPRKHD